MIEWIGLNYVDKNEIAEGFDCYGRSGGRLHVLSFCRLPKQHVRHFIEPIYLGRLWRSDRNFADFHDFPEKKE